MGLSLKWESSMPLLSTTSLSQSTSSVVIQETSARSPGRSSDGAFSRVMHLGAGAFGLGWEKRFQGFRLGVFHGETERAFGAVVDIEEVHGGVLAPADHHF